MTDRRVIGGCLAVVLGWNVAVAATKPASQPAKPLDPAIEKILDRLEKLKVKDIETVIIFIKRDPVFNDEQKYEGQLRFKKGDDNPVFLVIFDKFTHEGIVSRKKEWHAFKGRWYSEAREKTKQIVRREIVRPGEKLNVFELGEGPFPLPFGQKKQQIVKHFKIQLVPPAKGDPPNTDHLVCTPKPGTELSRKFKKVHFYVDKKLDLPTRVRTIAEGDEQEIQVDFPHDKIRLNKGLPGGKLELPKLKDYKERTETLPPPSKPDK